LINSTLVVNAFKSDIYKVLLVNITFFFFIKQRLIVLSLDVYEITANKPERHLLIEIIDFALQFWVVVALPRVACNSLLKLWKFLLNPPGAITTKSGIS